MRRRTLLGVLGASVTAGCLDSPWTSGDAESQVDDGSPERWSTGTTSRFYRNPTARSLPEPPDVVTDESAVAFASEYEAVAFHNAAVEEDATRIEHGCWGVVDATVETARYVLVHCGGAVYHGTTVGDYFTYFAAAYRVGPDGFDRIDELPLGSDDAVDATVRTTRGTGTAASLGRDVLVVANFDDATHEIDVALDPRRSGSAVVDISQTIAGNAGVTHRVPIREHTRYDVTIRLDGEPAASTAWTPEGALNRAGAATYVTPDADVIAGPVPERGADATQ